MFPILEAAALSGRCGTKAFLCPSIGLEVTLAKQASWPDASENVVDRRAPVARD